jgi:SAM-dependent methyltransferase
MQAHEQQRRPVAASLAQGTLGAMPPPLSPDAFFEHQLGESNGEFFRRIGPLDLRGHTVLDIGCGHGALALEAAMRGARRVIGVDVDEERIEFARRNMADRFPELAKVVSFTTDPIRDCAEPVDIALSKDTFEHVLNLPALMYDVMSVLRPRGLLAAGIGPLYFSPFGDHGLYWGARRFPWSAALIPEPLLMRLVSRRRGELVRVPADLGLNKLTPAAFRSIVLRQGWEIEGLEYNAGQRRGFAALRALRRVAALERYCTVNLYARLRKPSTARPA